MTTPGGDEAAAHLVAMRGELDAALALGQQIDAACETFRARYCPGAARVSVALGAVCTLGAGDGRVRLAYEAAPCHT